MIYILYVILFLLFAFLLLLVRTIYKQEAPSVPSPTNTVQIISDEIKDCTGTFYDLGCGHGKVIFSLASKNSNMQFVGIEIGILPYLFCITKKQFGCFKNTTFLKKDFRDIDIKNAGYVFMYLYPTLVDMLYEKIKKERSGPLTIFCIDFPIKQLTPTKQIETGTPHSKHTVFIYKLN
jgi:SAM-dependent methyltransferase